MNVLAIVVVGEPDRGSLDALAPLGGVPVVVRTVWSLLGVRGIDHVDLLVPGQRSTRAAHACAGMPVTLHGSATDLWAHAGQRPGYSGGDGRITDQACVLVHDAVRPLAPPALVDAVIGAVVAGHPVVVPVLPLTDTVKQVDDGVVGATPDRTGLRVVQTPQGFRGDLRPTLLPDPTRAWSTVDTRVHVVPGHPSAFAVHHTWDLELAESMIGTST